MPDAVCIDHHHTQCVTAIAPECQPRTRRRGAATADARPHGFAETESDTRVADKTRVEGPNDRARPQVFDRGQPLF